MRLEQAVAYALGEAEEPVSTATLAREEPWIAERPAMLTRREEEVAILVSRGLTNRQIASELSMSEHTVATHLAKARKKLGLSSRSQLSTWIAEQRLSSSDLG